MTITVTLSEAALAMLAELGYAPDELEWGRLVEDTVQFLYDAHKPRPQGAEGIDSREQLRAAYIQGIDSTTTGFLSRFISHESRKLLNAQRRWLQLTTPEVNAALDQQLQFYYQEP